MARCSVRWPQNQIFGWWDGGARVRGLCISDDIPWRPSRISNVLRDFFEVVKTKRTWMHTTG